MKKKFVYACIAFVAFIAISLLTTQASPAQQKVLDSSFFGNEQIESVLENPDSYYVKLSEVVGKEKFKKMSFQDLASLSDDDFQRLARENPESSAMKEFLIAQNRPLHLVNPGRTPEIWINTRNAFRAGKPRTLTYMNDASAARRNRAAACRDFTPEPSGSSCDEYPYASTYEGGSGASIRGVSSTEQSRQGGDLNSVYRRLGYRRGEQFDVALISYM
jgi:hypothetical protein